MRIVKFVIRSWLLVGLAALYVGWIFLTRWQENREFVRRAAEAKRVEAQRAAEALGGNRFEILNFYASPPAIHRGEAVQLCYGVSNAKSVRLEPPSGAVWPSYARCVAVKPTKTTAYTLTAEDSAGNSKTATVTVQVR
jgi:hypothetical protein